MAENTNLTLHNLLIWGSFTQRYISEKISLEFHYNLLTFLGVLYQEAPAGPHHTLHSIARRVGRLAVATLIPPVHKRMKSSLTAFWGGPPIIRIGTNYLNSGLSRNSGGLDTCGYHSIRISTKLPAIVRDKFWKPTLVRSPAESDQPDLLYLQTCPVQCSEGKGQPPLLHNNLSRLRRREKDDRI